MKNQIHLRDCLGLFSILLIVSISGCGPGPVIIPAGYTITPTVTELPNPTETPIPTPTSEPVFATCGNHFWPIIEGATWNYYEISDMTGDMHLTWKVQSIQPETDPNSSRYASFTLVEDSQFGILQQAFYCDPLAIYQLLNDGTDAFALPGESLFDSNSVFTFPSGKVSMQPYISITVNAGSFETIPIVYTSNAGASRIVYFSKEIGPVKIDDCPSYCLYWELGSYDIPSQ